jgi:hypothetical protein
VDDQDNAHEAETLAVIRLALASAPPPDMAELVRLLEQLQPLIEHQDETIAHQARLLELRILGASLSQQAAGLRALAGRLQQLARWLPPEHPEQN